MAPDNYHFLYEDDRQSNLRVVSGGGLSGHQQPGQERDASRHARSKLLRLVNRKVKHGLAEGKLVDEIGYGRTVRHLLFLRCPWPGRRICCPRRSPTTHEYRTSLAPNRAILPLRRWGTEARGYSLLEWWPSFARMLPEHRQLFWKISPIHSAWQATTRSSLVQESNIFGETLKLAAINPFVIK
jgi:hypothetical protein